MSFLSKQFFYLLFGYFFIISYFCWISIIFLENTLVLDLFISGSPLFLSVSLCLDKLSMIFTLVVTLISFVVFLYSIDYMIGENENKFYMIMFIFVSCMLILSLSCNMMWLMVSWDGLGLSSFCLVMYFMNWKSFNGAMITFVLNRLGDLFMMSSIIFMYLSGSFFAFQNELGSSFVFFLIFLCSISKSAQIPFSSWLPLAMAAPTPVSSLVHSSTLVTAGIFLCIRFIDLVSLDVYWLMSLISFLTVLMAGLSSLWEFDLKKIIALSTLSHIGFIFMFVSVGDLCSALIHLIIHAMFKSCLFMAAGSLIHCFNNQQDIRYLFISSSNSFLWSVFIVCCLSMMGVPFLSGFYSKELMMSSFMLFDLSFSFMFMFMFSVSLTIMYSCRLMISVFDIKFGSFSCLIPLGNFMNFSLLFGLLMSCLGGGLLVWLIVDLECFLNLDYVGLSLKFVLLSVMLISLSLWFSSLFYLFISKSYYFSQMFYVGYLVKVWSFFVLNYSFLLWGIEFFIEFFLSFILFSYLRSYKMLDLYVGYHVPLLKILMKMFFIFLFFGVFISLI